MTADVSPETSPDGPASVSAGSPVSAASSGCSPGSPGWAGGYVSPAGPGPASEYKQKFFRAVVKSRFPISLEK